VPAWSISAFRSSGARGGVCLWSMRWQLGHKTAKSVFGSSCVGRPLSSEKGVRWWASMKSAPISPVGHENSDQARDQVFLRVHSTCSASAATTGNPGCPTDQTPVFSTLSGDTGPHVSPPDRRRDPSAIMRTVCGFRTYQTRSEGNLWSGRRDRNKCTLHARRRGRDVYRRCVQGRTRRLIRQRTYADIVRDRAWSGTSIRAPVPGA
jgi:hypothetical protein